MTEQDVDTPAQADAEPPPRSSAELALEISRLVARALSGETIDNAASGAALAARFPDSGMSGEMIAQAIERATGMVGMIRDGEGPDAPGGAETADTGRSSDPGQSTDAALAAALDAELSDLVGVQMAEASSPPSPDASETEDKQAGEAEREAERETGSETGGSAPVRGRGLFARVAAMRRAFLRG